MNRTSDLCEICCTGDGCLCARAEILDACCGGRHWWWDKAHPLAVYMDLRQVPKGAIEVRPNWHVAPDVVGDFRAMPFKSETFQLVLFDPPHIVRETPSESFLRQKYGELHPDTEQDDLRRGFAECWRVLVPGGTLIFKWADKLERVEPHFPAPPIVGTRSPRGGQTRWFVFYKPVLTGAQKQLRWVNYMEAVEQEVFPDARPRSEVWVEVES